MRHSGTERYRAAHFARAALALIALSIAGCGARTGLLVATRDGASGCATAPWIVFDFADGRSGFEIAAIHPDGTGFHLVDLGGMHGFSPAISPDGHSLVFISGTDTEESLVVRDLRSGTNRTVAHTVIRPPSSGFTRAAVSPDNAWIAYGQTPDLHVVAFSGNNDRVLVTGPYEAGCCPWSYGHAVFSGDASTIYFSTIGILEEIHTDGRGRQRLWQDHFFANRTIPGFVFPNASLSPDHRQLVAEVGCDTSQLRIYDLASLPASDPCTAGSFLVEAGLSMAPNESSNASWGATGLVVYDDARDLFTIDAHGGPTTNVTSAVTTAPGAFAADPVWAEGCSDLR